jgi:hypothetical protein
MTAPDLAALRQGAATPTVEGPPKYTFTTPGEEVYGQVAQVRFNLDTQFGVGHLLELNDVTRGPITIWLSNVQLEAGLVQGRNQLGRPVAAGDIVYIRFDSIEPRQGGKTLKHFAINVAAGQAPAPAPAPAQVAAPQVYATPQDQLVGQTLGGSPFPSPV